MMKEEQCLYKEITMAKRIYRPSLAGIYKNGKFTANKAEDILKLIRSRQSKPNIWKIYPEEPERASPSADDWQKFKRDFVEEYGSELVQPTGMTHSDFFDYFKNGIRECDQSQTTLTRLLEELKK